MMTIIAIFFCNDVGKTYHLLFNQEKNQDEKIDIYIPSYEFNLDKYDTNRTKFRKRFILANASFSYITINKIGIKLLELTKDLDQNASSYQLSIYDYKKAKIVTKTLEMHKQKKSFESIYNDNYLLFSEFIQDFNDSLEKEKDFEDKFNKLKKKYKDVLFPDYFLNISKKTLKKNYINKNISTFFII